MGDETKACPNCGKGIPARATGCRFCAYDFTTGRVEAPPPLPAGAPAVNVGFVVAIVLIVLIVAAIAIPGLLAGSRASNDRNASASLKTLLSAEADFRSNDRDGDRIANFWVRDVYSLSALCPSMDGKSAPTPQTQNMIKLIEPSLAGADCSGRAPLPGVVPVRDAYGALTPKGSYVFRPFDRFEEGGATTPYGLPGGVAAWKDSFNDSRFAFMTLPTSRGAGPVAFTLNENGTILRIRLDASYSATYSAGPDSATLTWSGAPISAGDPWPSTRPASWQKLD